MISTVNGGPPPPFPNTLFQRLDPGEQPLTYGWYLWDADGLPLTGATVQMITARRGVVVDGDGTPVGSVRIRAPHRAAGVELVPTGPATAGPAFITDIPTALLRADLRIDPDVPGRYSVTIRLWRSNRRTMTVKA